MNKGMAYQKPVPDSMDWLTPPEIIQALGPFDLDPCCPPDMPWKTAETMLTKVEDGLTHPWFGDVWLNPPYGREVWDWVERLTDHGSGMALIFARTDVPEFQELVFNRADVVVFIRGRLFFHYPDGTRARNNGGAPSALVAYGRKMAVRLRLAGIDGFLVDLKGVT